MENAASPMSSARTRSLSGLVLCALWILFAMAHLATFGQTGKTSLLVFATAETLFAVFFLLRTPPKALTTKPAEWATAIAGTFLPLLVRPTPDAAIPIAEWGLMLGSALQITGVLSLNRSLAIVPALRELKSKGMYSLIRHPIYTSYLISFSCYLGGNFSLRNLVIIALSLGLMLIRIHFEERHLALTPEYRAYQSRVRWRLIPFVY